MVSSKANYLCLHTADVDSYYSPYTIAWEATNNQYIHTHTSGTNTWYMTWKNVYISIHRLCFHWWSIRRSVKVLFLQLGCSSLTVAMTAKSTWDLGAAASRAASWRHYHDQVKEGIAWKQMQRNSSYVLSSWLSIIRFIIFTLPQLTLVSSQDW